MISEASISTATTRSADSTSWRYSPRTTRAAVQARCAVLRDKPVIAATSRTGWSITPTTRRSLSLSWDQTSWASSLDVEVQRDAGTILSSNSTAGRPAASGNRAKITSNIKRGVTGPAAASRTACMTRLSDSGSAMGGLRGEDEDHRACRTPVTLCAALMRGATSPAYDGFSTWFRSDHVRVLVVDPAITTSGSSLTMWVNARSAAPLSVRRAAIRK